MAWDAGVPPEPAASGTPTGASSVRDRTATSDLRPPADSVIQRVAERASDERHNNTNVSHD